MFVIIRLAYLEFISFNRISYHNEQCSHIIKSEYQGTVFET